MPGRPLVLVDARPPVTWTAEEVELAVERQQKRAGALVALARERIEASWGEIRAELNQMAGGQASARVMVLAHHAMRAHSALELQVLLAEVGVGEEAKGADAGLRNQSGLSVIASQALNAAYDAAREEGKASRGSATDQLFGRLGVGQGRPGVDVGGSQPQSPFSPPGGVGLGPPSSSTPIPPKESE
jgi:hypothetical protein